MYNYKDIRTYAQYLFMDNVIIYCTNEEGIFYWIYVLIYCYYILFVIFIYFYNLQLVVKLIACNSAR